MAATEPDMPLPERWPDHVKAGLRHVISLARVALVAARDRRHGQK